MFAPVFYTISSVREDISRYEKHNSYRNCWYDLCTFFSNKSIDIIFSHPYLLYDGGKVRYIKSRLSNSNNGQGKSSGYRVYYYVDKESGSITILGFYPKTGKYGRTDISPSDEKQLIRRYREEKAAGKLACHDMAGVSVLEGS